MYLRLTSRCNMTCAHCGFSCGKRGKDMSKEVFKAALKLVYKYSEAITLGGGEPTLHPEFWEFFGLALAIAAKDDGRGLYIVTNGSITETALALASLAKTGVIYASLSQDYFHDPIDPQVVAAFTRDKFKYGSVDSDNRAICTANLEKIIDVGRAKKNNIGQRKICFCDDIVIEPDGRLWACACRKQSFGTVFAPAIPENYWEKDDRCSRAT